MRFITMVRSAESNGPPPPELMEAMAKLVMETAESGKLVEAGGLAPTSAGARVRLSGGRLTVTDGPFAEAKEVIGGYAILELDSKEQAIQEATRFLELHRKYWKGWEGESEIRQLDDTPPEA